MISSYTLNNRLPQNHESVLTFKTIVLSKQRETQILKVSTYSAGQEQDDDKSLQRTQREETCSFHSLSSYVTSTALYLRLTWETKSVILLIRSISTVFEKDDGASLERLTGGKRFLEQYRTIK